MSQPIIPPVTILSGGHFECKCRVCGEELSDAVKLAVLHGGPAVCGKCIDKRIRSAGDETSSPR